MGGKLGGLHAMGVYGGGGGGGGVMGALEMGGSLGTMTGTLVSTCDCEFKSIEISRISALTKTMSEFSRDLLELRIY